MLFNLTELFVQERGVRDSAEGVWGAWVEGDPAVGSYFQSQRRL